MIIDNYQLSHVQKLNYLKSSLKGEAAYLNRNLSVAFAGNFDIPWNTLSVQYQNEHLIVAKWINSISDLPVTRNDDIKFLKTLLETVTLAVDALTAFQMDIKDRVLVGQIIRKFDKPLHASWQKNTRVQSLIRLMTP